MSELVAFTYSLNQEWRKPMTRRHALTFIAVILFCGSCATAPRPRDIVNSFGYSESEFDAVWSAVVETFAEMNLPIDNMEKDSGLITTDRISFLGTKNDDVCDCGGTGILVEQARTGKFNVFVKRGADGVSVQINTQFKQTLDFDGSLSTRPCVSTGRLETTMNEHIRQKLGR